MKTTCFGRKDHPDWWQFNRESLCLEQENGYYVDLERCLTSAQVLDWIIQVSEKTWATPAMVYHLIEGLNALLYPQSNLCSWGKNKVIADGDIRELALKNERRWLADQLFELRTDGREIYHTRTLKDDMDLLDECTKEVASWFE